MLPNKIKGAQMDKSIGRWIAEARKSAGFSQSRLAEQLHVTQQCVGKWERDESLPDIHMLRKIAEVLGVGAFDIGCCTVAMSGP